MRISIIAALSTNGAIGLGNGLPWGKISTDLKRFKSLTMGHHLLMGRKTWDTVGKPLPGRINVVITRKADAVIDGVHVAHSLDEGIRRARQAGDDECFIGGGAEIFRLALHVADRMYLTRVHAELEGDTYFPDFDDVSEWRLVDSEHFAPDEKNEHPFSFLLYERAAAGGHAIPEEG
ncbi:MAG TPA: dihydrofolate reductase [Thermoanaerobaculia bacterium]|jgi:dihydrofolate reductase